MSTQLWLDISSFRPVQFEYLRMGPRSLHFKGMPKRFVCSFKFVHLWINRIMVLPLFFFFLNKIRQLAIFSPFISYLHVSNWFCAFNSLACRLSPVVLWDASAASAWALLLPQDSTQPLPLEQAVLICLNAWDSVLGFHLLPGDHFTR